MHRANWGVRVERKHDVAPFSGYLAYQGRYWTGGNNLYPNFPDSSSGSQHAVVVGIRALLNAATLQELDDSVGLTDMNQMFGDWLPH